MRHPARFLVLALFLGLVAASPVRAHADDTPSPQQTVTAITALLGEFLTRVDDPAMHARFWADDLVYTSGKAEVKTKAEIVAGVAAAAQASAASTARTSYGAEDVRVRPYGVFAALNFRLLVKNPDGTQWYARNSGTFIWRDGRWQVVTWQATREP